MAFHPKPYYTSITANISNLAHIYHTYQPSQTLACSYQKHLISYGIISWSKWNIGMAASKHTSYPRQQTNHEIIKQTCYCILLLRKKTNKETLSMFIIQTRPYSYQCMLMRMHDLPYLPYFISAPMHQ